MDHNQQGQGQHGQGRRGHFNRGRRGPERRGQERRPPSATPEDPQAARGGARGDVDVEQIMRDIRTRIAQRHGIELSVQQVRELAARRLEAILDPRNLSPELLAQLRRSAGAPPVDEPADRTPLPTYAFEEDTLYESHRGLLRTMRRLLNPLLKLFFNPNPIVHALNTQARVNTELDRRTAGHESRQAEWNALHFELLQRMVTENARLSIEVQQLALKVESLAARVDFADRRVRGLEATPAQRHQPSHRSQGPQHQHAAPPPAAAPPQTPDPVRETVAPSPAESAGAIAAAPDASAGQGEAPRKRRRRRRGRRGDRPMNGEGGTELQAGADGAESDDGEGDSDDAPEASPASQAGPTSDAAPAPSSGPSAPETPSPAGDPERDA